MVIPCFLTHHKLLIILVIMSIIFLDIQGRKCSLAAAELGKKEEEWNLKAQSDFQFIVRTTLFGEGDKLIADVTTNHVLAR
jgi:hypothetical protein